MTDIKVFLSATMHLADGVKTASTVLSKKSSTGARLRKVARKEEDRGWIPHIQGVFSHIGDQCYESGVL